MGNKPITTSSPEHSSHHADCHAHSASSSSGCGDTSAPSGGGDHGALVGQLLGGIDSGLQAGVNADAGSSGTGSGSLLTVDAHDGGVANAPSGGDGNASLLGHLLGAGTDTGGAQVDVSTAGAATAGNDALLTVDATHDGVTNPNDHLDIHAA